MVFLSVLCKRSPVISFFSWLLEAFRLCHCLRLAHILPNLCLTVCLSECLPNIVRYLVQRLCPLFRPVFHTFFSTFPPTLSPYSPTTSWLLFISWLGCLSSMICDFPAIYAKICDEISAPPRQPKAVCLLNCNSFVFLFHLKYLSFRRHPPLQSLCVPRVMPESQKFAEEISVQKCWWQIFASGSKGGRHTTPTLLHLLNEFCRLSLAFGCS